MSYLGQGQGVGAGGELTSNEEAWVQNGTLGILEFLETTAPVSEAGVGKLYVKSSDGDLYFLDSSGVETGLLTPSSGGSDVTFNSLTVNDLTVNDLAFLNHIKLPELTDTPDPLDDFGFIYVKTDNLPYYLSSAGVETDILTSGSGAPIGAQYVTIATNASLTAERVLTGTANQIVITDNGANSTVVLSTPQSIATTSTVTFGSVTTTQAGLPLSATNSTDNASVQVALLQGDRATMADNDEAYITMRLSDDGGTQTEVARLTWVATDVNAGTSVDGRIDFAVMTGGSLADELQLDGAALSPSTTDGLSLGTTLLNFSDLFLDSGAVIDFDGGDVVMTHSANTLTFTGGTVALGTATATGGLTGNVTGDVTGNVSGNAGTLTVADEAADTTCFVGFYTAASGSLAGKTNAGLTFNASTAVLTATGFVGPLTGDVTGNVSGTAATVTGAAQTAITSLGTLTALDVDNININGNTISSTAGTDLLITPLAGQQLILDGTIIIDAGEITGITSLGLTGTRVTAGFFTDLTVTNSIAGSITGTAAIATTVTAANEATDTTCFPVFVTAATGDLGPKTNANLTYNSNTGSLASTTFVGALTGNVTGNVTGSAGTVTGFTPASGSLTLSGDDALTLTTSAATNVTLPTTGTLATLAGSETLSSKTLTAPIINAATITGNINIAAVPASDHTANGPTTSIFNLGATIALMDLVYLGSSSKWLLTDADAAATAGGVMLGICLDGGVDTDTTTVALKGSFVRDDTWNWTPGAVLYIDTATAGQITATQPSGADDVIRVVGFAVTADVIWFDPSPDYFTHT